MKTNVGQNYFCVVHLRKVRIFKYTVSTPEIIVMFIMFHSSLIKDMTWIT
jgi:hypothetical protein